MKFWHLGRWCLAGNCSAPSCSILFYFILGVACTTESVDNGAKWDGIFHCAGSRQNRWRPAGQRKLRKASQADIMVDFRWRTHHRRTHRAILIINRTSDVWNKKPVERWQAAQSIDSPAMGCCWPGSIGQPMSSLAFSLGNSNHIRTSGQYSTNWFALNWWRNHVHHALASHRNCLVRLRVVQRMSCISFWLLSAVLVSVRCLPFTPGVGNSLACPPYNLAHREIALSIYVADSLSLNRAECSDPFRHAQETIGMIGSSQFFH